MPPCSRIQATATDVSKPPENARPMRSPWGKLCRMRAMGAGGSRSVSPGAACLGVQTEHVQRRGGDLVVPRKRRLLEVLGVRERHLGRADALHGRVEIVEAGAADARGDLR